MYIYGRWFYKVTITSQHEYGAFDACAYGLKTSEHKPNRILRASIEKPGYTLSKHHYCLCYHSSMSFLPQSVLKNAFLVTLELLANRTLPLQELVFCYFIQCYGVNTLTYEKTCIQGTLHFYRIHYHRRACNHPHNNQSS